MASDEKSSATEVPVQTAVPTPESITQGFVSNVRLPECNRPATPRFPSPPPGLSIDDRVRATNEGFVMQQAAALAAMPPATQRVIENDAWVKQPHSSAPILLGYIAQLEKCLDSMARVMPQGRYRTVDEILTASAAKPWYQDGLSTDDFGALINFYDVYLMLSGIHLGSPQLVREPGLMLVEALERDVAQGFRMPRGGRRSMMVFMDDPQAARDAYQLAADVLPRMEAFASVLQPAGIVILAVPTDSVCGQTPARIAPGVVQLVIVGSRCINQHVIYHELAHAFIGPEFPGWYAEGIAEFIAANLLGTLDLTYAQYRLSSRGTLPMVELNTRYSSRVPAPQYAAGFTFLKDVYDIIGEAGMGEVVRGQRPSASGAVLLDAIRGQTPPDKLPTLEALIEQRVDPTR